MECSIPTRCVQPQALLDVRSIACPPRSFSVCKSQRRREGPKGLQTFGQRDLLLTKDGTTYICKANISESTEYEDMPNQDLGVGKRVQHVEPPPRHAVLHDFCMVIPYGALMVLAGLLSLAFKSGAVGLRVAAVGVLQLLLATLSLGSWRKGKPSTVYTLTAGVGSAGLSYLFYCNVRDGVARLPNSLVLLPSVALTLFLLYNVAAGGNPPKKAQEA